MSLLGELMYLRGIFAENVYSAHDINWALDNGNGTKQVKDPQEIKGCVFLPFFGVTSSKVDRLIINFALFFIIWLN